MPIPLGLSESEVRQRQARGLGNDVELPTSRTYWEIVRRNAFTFINTILFAIGIALIAIGQYGDAVITAGLVLLNVIVGVIQEGRAKRKLDQIALLARPKVTALRDGRERPIDPSEVVLGDVLVVRPGDQIVVDGQVLDGGPIEVDESLLTGEADLVTKQVGDAVYSGSFCTTGSAAYEAQKVGHDSFVHQLSAQARKFRQVKTPLQRDINFVIRILVLLVVQLGILLGISFLIQGRPMVEGVRVAAVIVALVPQGLFFMTTVAYAMGAVRVSERGALIQQSNAVESTSNINLLCLDKTGTLTTNRIELRAVLPGASSPVDESGLRELLGDFAASTPDANRTAQAIAQSCGGTRQPLQQRIPFSSATKWSALAFADPQRPGLFVLGAPEVLQPHLAISSGLEPHIESWISRGLRVLLFAHHPDVLAQERDERPALPGGLLPLGALCFSDELRPEAQKTMEHFSRLGIGLKIISGDNPHAVAALARQAGLGQEITAVSGLDLASMDDAQLQQTVKEATIFGRITPQQKETLVGILCRQGHYVAMMGDGVNDVLSLKKAHLGIAMQSGSQATRSVADIVLLNDAFSVLPIAFREGQRIVRGMEDIVRLLLTRTLYVTLLILVTGFIGVDFPVTPTHNSILALLTVGIPILAIAAWARPGPAPKSVLRSTVSFVLPAAFTISVVAVVVYLLYLTTTHDLAVARTALTTVSVFCGLLLIPFVEPPTPGWVGGDELSGDWRPTILALGMLLLYAIVLAIPALRHFFELVPLALLDYAILAGLAILWALVTRYAWRADLLSKVVGRAITHEG